LNETANQCIEEGYTPVKTVAGTLSTILEKRNELPVQLVSPKEKAYPLFCLFSF